jgi:hypothetical protein
MPNCASPLSKATIRAAWCTSLPPASSGGDTLPLGRTGRSPEIVLQIRYYEQAVAQAPPEAWVACAVSWCAQAAAEHRAAFE